MPQQSGTVSREEIRLEDTKQRIADLPKLQRSQLLELWYSNFGKSAPAGIRRELMITILAYRIQERAYGGLKKETILKLHKLARQFAKPASASIRAERVKTGTKIVRQWGGHSHEVTVASDGFLYRDTTYKSLSEIARQITGTRWSGPLFFGLKRTISRGEGQ